MNAPFQHAAQLAAKFAALESELQKSHVESKRIEKELNEVAKELKSVFLQLDTDEKPPNHDRSNSDSAPAANMTQKILTLLNENPGKEFSAEQVFVGLHKEFPLTSIASTLGRLAENGRIERSRRGHFRTKALSRGGELSIVGSKQKESLAQKRQA
jgi:hypothetical protein